MLRALYTLILWLALPWIVVRLKLRSRKEPGYARNIRERFGDYAGEVPRPLIWVHAVSVGEVRASVPLIAALKSAYPEYAVLVTCMTAAGRDAVEQAYGDTVLCAYLPYDYPFAVRRFLDWFRPRLAVLVETEIWINLLTECRRRSLPVVLANARMSAGSARGYRRFGALTRPVFESLAEVCAQSEADANRIAALGAHHVSVAGNLKFDVETDGRAFDAGTAFKASLEGRRVLLLASTREGEESLLLEALAGRLMSGILLVVVPRHPRRFDEVAAAIASAGLSFARRSRGEAVSGASVLLGDSMGEMAFYYALADVAVIGGSLLPYGGQNLIEACAAGVPVVIGPHVFNFSEAVRLAVESGAAQQVADAAGAIDEVLALLEDPLRRQAMGAAGKALCASHRGATRRHISSVRKHLPA